MTTFDNFEELKRKVQEVNQKHDKTAGAIEQIIKQIRKRFGCKTLEEAEELLKKFESRERKASVEYNQAKIEFEKKWSKALGEL